MVIDVSQGFAADKVFVVASVSSATTYQQSLVLP